MATTRSAGAVTNRSGLFQIVVVAAVVLLLLVITFVVIAEEPVSDTVAGSGDVVEQRPTGAGTIPEGNVDRQIEGITEELDEVDPAAPGVDTVPPAEVMDATGDATGSEVDDTGIALEVDEPGSGLVEGVEAPAPGSTDGADAQGIDGDGMILDAPEGDPGTPGDAVADDGTDAEPTAVPIADDDAATEPAEEGAQIDTDGGATATEEVFEVPLTEEGFDADRVVEPTAEGAPSGRDAVIDLKVEPGQDVVTDPDGGGTPFIPTPSGPEGGDDSAISPD